MNYKRVSGNTQEGDLIKGIGDLIKIDGITYEVEEVNTYKDEYADVYSFDYTLKKVEETAEDLQKL